MFGLDGLAIGVIGLLILGIIGSFAYLFGEINKYRKALKEQIAETLEANNRAVQAETSALQRSASDYLVMNIPDRQSPTSPPRIIEIEKEMDSITDALSFDAEKRLKSDERKELEDKYDSLIREMTQVFVHEADRNVLTISLSGETNERKQEGIQGHSETPVSPGQTSGA